MAYKKYIVKNGKVYGPYVYHSRRVNGKVVSEYHGTEKLFDYKKFVWIFAGIFLVIFLIYSIDFVRNKISGEVVFGLDANYIEGESMEGVLRLSLKEGELIPASTKVVFETSGQTYEYVLSDLVGDDMVDGDFYIEGKDVSGTGEGYGVKGEAQINPVVYFILDIYSKKSSKEKEEEISGSSGAEEIETEETEEVVSGNETQEPEITEEVSEVNETEITGEVIEEPEPIEEVVEEEIPVEEPTEAEIQEETPTETTESSEEPEPEESSEAQETPTEEAPITGGIVTRLVSGLSNLFLTITGQVSLELKNEINGQVSVGDQFVYNLSKGQSVEIRLGSVRTDSKELSENDIKLSVNGNQVIATTDYFEPEQGFGENYLGGSEKELVIDLANLNLTFEKDDLKVSLVYEDEEIISLVTLLEEGEIDVEIETAEEIIEVIEGNVSLNVTRIEIGLSEEERKVLIEEFGNVSVETTKAELFNGRIIIRYELGNYWIEFSYDENEDVKALSERDRSRWLRSLVSKLLQEKNIPEKTPKFIGNYSL